MLADNSITSQAYYIALGLYMVQSRKLLTLHCWSFLGGSSDVVSECLCRIAANIVIVGTHRCAAFGFYKMQGQKALTLC
jgi:hypothetical protein